MTAPWDDGPCHEDVVLGPFDVAVIGAGVAGTMLARFLADEGANVVLLDGATRIGAEGAGPGLGHAFLGLAEPAFRLAHALGEDTTREIYDFTRASLDLLDRSFLVGPRGGVWAAVDAREPAELDASLAVLSRIGVRAESWDAARTNTTVGARALGPALFLADELAFDPIEALGALAASARRSGARVRCGARVTAIEDTADGVVIGVGERSVRAESAVLTGGAGLAHVVGFLDDTLVPWREHACAVPVEGAVPALPLRAQYGYTTIQRAPSGHAIVRGARWATPHLEMGETAPTTVPAVQAKLDAIVERHLPGAASPTHRWAWIETGTCDGLPLVGPVPGRPRINLCTGFGGNRWGLAPQAARAVADGLLTGRTTGAPAIFLPARMI